MDDEERIRCLNWRRPYCLNDEGSEVETSGLVELFVSTKARIPQSMN